MIAAVVPAAGQSSRMGRPKLLLKLGHDTVIGQVVIALRQGGVNRVIVTAPPADAAEGPAVAAEARRAGAEVVVPQSRPIEMRDSVELALDTLARGATPHRVLLTPGDSPGIRSELVVKLLEVAARWPERILIPCFEGRRGHPIVLPWVVATEVRSLPAGQGVNALITRHQDNVMELPVSDPEVVADLDTPDDLRRWNETSQPITKMHVRVRLFALAKDLAGCSEIEVELPAAPTVADLRVALGVCLPALGPLWPNVVIAVDEEYALDDTLISPGSRIAVIPPVSGGTGEPSDTLPLVSWSRGLYRL
jgi:molybdenum cofactor cytidylyltransferase